MPTEDDLLAGIVAHPLEADRWLVLADWLEDQQDARAELARLRYLLHTEPDHAYRDQRHTRQQALLDSGLAPVVPTWTNSLGMTFALILPGTFWMGSPEEEKDHEYGEVRHRVTLTEPFFLGVYPVTVGEFERFVAATNYQTEAETGGGAWGFVGGGWKQDPAITWRSPDFAQTDRHPVVCVSWNDAREMVNWLNEGESDRVYSLPTEAQWEYACRAGSATAYFWGDGAAKLGDYAWFSDNSDEKTHPVETKRPNPWGLLHMHGLVWEWCADWYDDYPSGPVQNPLGASGGTFRVSRGGARYYAPAYCRSASRGDSDPASRDATYGIRLAVSVPPSGTATPVTFSPATDQ